MWLYKLTSKTTGKSYVGATQRPVSYRMSSHKHAALTTKRTTPICQAIREHGIDDFIVTVLAKANDRDHLLFMEAKAIAVYNTLTPHGYNFYASGLETRRPHRQETKAKQSARKQGYIPWNAGKKTGPLSLEQRQRMSEAQRRRIKATAAEQTEVTPKDCEV